MLLHNLPHLVIISAMQSCVKPALEFGVFHSVVPLDYHGAVKGPRVCCLLEPTRGHCVCPTSRHVFYRVQYLLHYPHRRFCLPLGREAVLPQKTLHLFTISLPLDV